MLQQPKKNGFDFRNYKEGSLSGFQDRYKKGYILGTLAVTSFFEAEAYEKLCI